MQEDLNAELNSLKYESRDAEVNYLMEILPNTEKIEITSEDEVTRNAILERYGIWLDMIEYLNSFDKSLIDFYKKSGFLTKNQTHTWLSIKWKRSREI